MDEPKHFSVENIGSLSPHAWPVYRKHAPTRMVRVDGPFVVETSEGQLRCEDGFLAIDARGYPYPIAADEQKQIYALDLGGEEQQTRPSAIVQTISQERRVGECSDVELLNEVKQRLDGKRETLPRGPNPEARELSIAVTHIEDAITRTNKAHYLHDGRYAVTDAER